MLHLDHALEALSLAGLKRTPQRIAVIEALVDDRTHPTVEDVWAAVRARMPNISKSTVYATLRELESLGLIQYVPDDEAMRVDPDVAPHAHLTCEVCGHVHDVSDEGASDGVREAAERDGHKVERVSIVAKGVCAGCSHRGHSRQFLES